MNPPPLALGIERRQPPTLAFGKWGGKLKQMDKKIIITLFFGAALFLVVAAPQVMAAPPSGGTTGDSTEQVIDLKDLSPLGTCGQLDCILEKIMDLIYYLSIPITSIMVLWGGFQILTAAGSPEKVKTGGKTVLYAAIGFAVVILSRAVTYLITDIISK